MFVYCRGSENGWGAFEDHLIVRYQNSRSNNSTSRNLSKRDDLQVFKDLCTKDVHCFIVYSSEKLERENCYCSVMSDSLWPHGLEPTRLFCPWDFPGKNTGVGCHSLIQGIVPTQGLNSGLLGRRRILRHLSHHGSPLRTWKPPRWS